MHWCFRACWRALQYANGPADGPMALASHALQTLQWSWVSPFHIQTPDGTIDLRDVDAGAFDHMVRGALRQREWAAAAKRRSDMEGIEGGVNRDATQAYSASSKTAPLDKSLLRTIPAGGLRTQDRKFRAGMVDANSCPHCSSGEKEDQAHIWWNCSAWRHIRQQFPDVARQHVDAWAPCMRMCGIVPGTFQAPLDLQPPTREAQLEVIDLTAVEERRSGQTWAAQGRAEKWSMLARWCTPTALVATIGTDIYVGQASGHSGLKTIRSTSARPWSERPKRIIEQSWPPCCPSSS